MDLDSDTFVRFPLRGTVRVLARVIDRGPTGATVELVGSREKVTLTGSAWRAVESWPVRGQAL